MHTYNKDVCPPVPPVYPPYQPQVYGLQRGSEEDEGLYSYASLVRPNAPFRENERVDPFQYPYHGYNTEKNYGNPNLPPRYSQEPETSQGSSVNDRLRRRPSRNRRERRAAATANQPPHMSPPLQYQTQRVHSPVAISPPQLQSYKIDDG
ncbi:hypothetical protein Fot_07721 [Forsythia ovata]|uniref:Uncharacterized protein n=1 Tax=Forsythia ovata TaxID=205694 RepID=A0ABD1WX22_9LAMI